MPHTHPVPGFADTFALILDALCRATAARMARNWAAIPVLMLLWKRLRRLTTRFTSLAARAAAGRLIPPRPRKQRPARQSAPYQRLPMGFGWVVYAVPGAACYRGQLEHLMQQKEFAALLDAAPQAARLLRPLCRILALPDPKPKQPRPPAQNSGQALSENVEAALSSGEGSSREWPPAGGSGSPPSGASALPPKPPIAAI